jgi:hypothetical protein
VAPEQLKEPQNAFPGSGHQSEELEELKNLSEENRKLKLERKILKKRRYCLVAPLFFGTISGYDTGPEVIFGT